MPDILLTTLNARHFHTAFGLRYLFANLGELQARAELIEFDLQARPLEVAESLLARSPRIIGLGVYIWNVALCTELVALLKAISPETTVILGGPEVSHEWNQQAIVDLADYVIRGEADLEFAQLCRSLLAGGRPREKVLSATPPDLTLLTLPYEFYTDHDVTHRTVYVEASRGCPFGCEFCLSALEAPVRLFPLPPLLANFEQLLRRGARHFKFVDRAFNANRMRARDVLEFFLGCGYPDVLLHCEMVPDRFPESLRELLARFPPGHLQCEIGLQTFNEQVARSIGRRQNNALAEANLRFLRESTGAHLHTDLLVGLPGESLASLAAGFDRLVDCGPQEIQVGLLKRLRGALIDRHTQACQMVYAPAPPYEVLRSNLIDFPTMQRLRRFARYWDLVSNSGNFRETVTWILGRQGHAELASSSQGAEGTHAFPPGPTPPRPAPETSSPPSAFAAFLRFSDWLHTKVGRQHGIALPRLTELLFTYLTLEMGHAPQLVLDSLARDYQRGGRRDLPPLWRAQPVEEKPAEGERRPKLPAKRQRKHLA